jgi:hypothetical protein
MDRKPISAKRSRPGHGLRPAELTERATRFELATLTLAKKPLRLADQGKRAVFPGHGLFRVSFKPIDMHQQSRVMWTKCGQSEGEEEPPNDGSYHGWSDEPKSDFATRSLAQERGTTERCRNRDRSWMRPHDHSLRRDKHSTARLSYEPGQAANRTSPWQREFVESDASTGRQPSG